MAKTVDTKTIRDNQAGKTTQTQTIKDDGKGLWFKKSERTIVKVNGRVVSDKTEY